MAQLQLGTAARPEPYATPLSERGEVDLIDLLGFVWLSRKYVAVGVILGAVVACSVWIGKSRSRRLGATSEIWVEKFSSNDKNTSIMPNTVVEVLKSSFKHHDGLILFFDNLPTVTGGTREGVDRSIDDQLAGHGFIRSVDTEGSDIVFTTALSTDLSKAKTSAELQKAVNATLEGFNGKFIKRELDLQAELSECDEQLARDRGEALRLFDEKSTFTGETKRSLVLGFLSMPVHKIDGMALLFSSIPDADKSKARLLASYRTHLILQSKLNALISDTRSATGVLNFVAIPAPQLSLVDKVQDKAPPPASLPLPVPSGSILLPLTVGALAGFAIALFASLFKNYISLNRKRIVNLFQA